MKPETRGDCVDGPRPCKWDCRYRIAGPDSCSLDVADRVRIGDTFTLDETGEALGVTRERARQIEVAALEKLRLAFLELFGEELDHDEIARLLDGLRQLGTSGEGKQIAGMREGKGLSRPEFADLVGIKVDALQRFERGRQPIPADVLARMLDVLHEGAEEAAE